MRRGEIKCAEAHQLINSYFRDPALVRIGNTQSAEFSGWQCVSPTATAAEINGYGARCTRDADEADVVVGMADPVAGPAASPCSADRIAADMGRLSVGGDNCHGGFPSAVCIDEARAQGVPDAELSNFAPCTDASPLVTIETGDLGLTTPITVPACDGQGIVVLHSATQPGQYDSEIATALSNHPGAMYLRTDRSCPSLRQSLEGNPIYAVYRPAGRTLSELCTVVAKEGGSAYGKWLDTTSDPTAVVSC